MSSETASPARKEFKADAKQIVPRRGVPNYIPTERTSSSSFKSPKSVKQEPKPVVEPETSTLSTALDYISSPVKYITSVFTQPAQEPEKSPPKPKQNSPSKPKGSPKPIKIATTAGINQAMEVIVDRPVDALSMEPTENARESNEIVQHAPGKDNQHVPMKDKKTASKASDHKRPAETKRSNSLLIKTSSKTHGSVGRHGDGRKAASSSVRGAPKSPRILSSSSVKIAANNSHSYRVTSTEKEDAANKVKKPQKKVFKIDRERDKSPNNSSRASMPPKIPTDKRDDLSFHYLPLNSIEISRN